MPTIFNKLNSLRIRYKRAIVITFLFTGGFAYFRSVDNGYWTVQHHPRDNPARDTRSSLETDPMVNCTVHDKPQIIDQYTNKNKTHPIQFLRYLKNPCWYESFNNAGIETLPKNPFIELRSHTDISQQITKLANVLKSRLKSTSGVHLRCLPYFNIVGQAKCGTTDLYDRLTRHPHILMGMVKEPFWFSHGGAIPFDSYVTLNDLAAIRIEDQLRSNNCANQSQSKKMVIGEASVAMFSEQLMALKNSVFGQNPQETMDTPHFMNWILPESKIIIILRDPVARLYSDYAYFGKLGSVSEADFHNRTLQSLALFKNCSQLHGDWFCANDLNFISQCGVTLYRGLYSVMLKDWLKAFPRNNVLVLRMEDYSADLAKTFQKIYKFLDLEIPSAEQSENILRKEISNKGVNKVGQMWNSTRDLLYKFYQPYNRELSKMLNDKSFLWE